MDDSLIPPSINDARSRALHGLSGRLYDLPVSIIDNLYNPDLCEASALPSLGLQFGVLDEGWNLAGTEAKKRELVKKALTLQSRRGTPWALKEAVAAMGFPGMTLIERSNSWANFKLRQPLGGQPLSQVQLSRLLATIDRWKPARCVLESVEIGISFESNATGGTGARYDGSKTHNAAIKYEGLILANVAYAKIGASSPLVQVNALTVDDFPDRLEVSFQVDTETANGIDVDTFAVYSIGGTEIARGSTPAVYKSSGITLAVTWTIHKI